MGGAISGGGVRAIGEDRGGAASAAAGQIVGIGRAAGRRSRRARDGSRASAHDGHVFVVVVYWCWWRWPEHARAADPRFASQRFLASSSSGVIMTTAGRVDACEHEWHGWLAWRYRGRRAGRRRRWRCDPRAVSSSGSVRRPLEEDRAERNLGHRAQRSVARHCMQIAAPYTRPISRQSLRPARELEFNTAHRTRRSHSAGAQTPPNHAL